jgi:ABC-type xylose transport system permease subunit
LLLAIAQVQAELILTVVTLQYVLHCLQALRIGRRVFATGEDDVQVGLPIFDF